MAQFTKEILSVGELPSGDHLSIAVFRYKGKGKGPSVYIQANVHGAEVQGNAVIYQLMKYLQNNDPLGDVVLIPQANPHGGNYKMGEYTFGRFETSSGVNWNRIFWRATCEDEVQRKDAEQINLAQFVKKHESSSWEQIKSDFKISLAGAVSQRLVEMKKSGTLDIATKLGLTLQRLAFAADIALDLHTGPISTRYIYVPEYAVQSVLHFQIPHMIIVPRIFDGAMDEATFCPWWDLKVALEKAGRDFPVEFESVTLEKGGQERINLAEALEDGQRIVGYLKYKGALEKTAPDLMKLAPSEIYACQLKNYRALYAPQGGLVEFTAKPGEKIPKGGQLCQFLNFRNIREGEDLDQALTRVAAPEDCLIINHFPSAGVSEGVELYRFFTHFWKVEDARS